jgi:hypothetical protein
MTIAELMTAIGEELSAPVAYSHFKKAVTPPYLVYLGAGQDQFEADDTVYWRRNVYTIEYYFTKKDESIETTIEDMILAAGWQFDKSDDTYIQDEGINVIYYNLQ